jgi:hypothetical protein
MNQGVPNISLIKWAQCYVNSEFHHLNNLNVINTFGKSFTFLFINFGNTFAIVFSKFKKLQCRVVMFKKFAMSYLRNFLTENVKIPTAIEEFFFTFFFN